MSFKRDVLNSLTIGQAVNRIQGSGLLSFNECLNSFNKNMHHLSSY